MRKPHPDSEEALENAAISEIFDQMLGWETRQCYKEDLGENGTLGRNSQEEVVLVRYLRRAIEKFNPNAPQEAIDLAIEEITRNRSTLTPASANQEIYKLLKNGVKVSFRDDDNEEQVETLQIINWNSPTSNHFLMVSQFWISGEYGRCRADLVGFVNGLPLVFIELKAHHKRLENAYKKNLSEYKSKIPQLFWYNAVVILSNGSKSRIGSMTASWEHFSEWKKISDENETGIISLDTILQGTCDKQRLLDLVENYTFFYAAKGSLVKIIGKNHQFLGVNNAIEAVREIQHNQGKLGVFWHTQGSGKSYSMVFFTQKILRKLPGNWTFLIVTDRDDLDEQIYKNFAYAGIVTEPEHKVRASSAAHLERMLEQEDHRFVFTLIQKFRTEKGEQYRKLSDRSDIIVIADEAHRSQYDTFALNMRNALPNAAFIGFTGTPLLAGEERTREVFGDYVSVYNFRQSVEDQATVRLFYENRIPELQLTNDDLDDDMQNIIETATLDEEQEKLLERQCSRQYQLIVRDDRLEKVAADIVKHFIERDRNSKAMVISIDRFTAVKMYDKVRKYWEQEIESLKRQLAESSDLSEFEQRQLSRRIRELEETDMAVVVSPSQGEIEAFRDKGLDIEPHRKRLVNESPGLDEKFKDADHPLRMVFVCAMWITGFDVPSCSTIYLDKPMRNHTLMQTIARANRVFQSKQSGLIVDYIGVFRNLQEALAIYGSASGGGVEEGDTPIKDKSEQIEQLRGAISEALSFCQSKQIDLFQIAQTQNALVRTSLWDNAVEAVLESDDTKRTYYSLVGYVSRLYDAVLPDVRANEFTFVKMLLEQLIEEIYARTDDPDATGVVSDVMGEVEDLLDESILAGEFIIHASDQKIDLTQLNFEELAERFNRGQKRTEAEKLKGTINSRLQQMVRLNRTRINYLEKFQGMIEDYNSGSHNVEVFFRELIQFAQMLGDEDKRRIAENLSEEELAIFDLLTQPKLDLTEGEEQAVKQIARELLETLKREKLVLDWRKRQQTKAAVEVAIKDILDKLPDRYSAETYEQKCREVYQHIYESYSGQGQSIYESAN
ncbi:type I restriction endonuclease subunit R [Pseudanabaenaceae cyanobacterium LEGE 13415]|nr:type I restriction endonuclease subunit R [Pseudanabaenaceae cyanobacterium LEGE 13415]